MQKNLQKLMQLSWPLCQEIEFRYYAQMHITLFSMHLYLNFLYWICGSFIAILIILHSSRLNKELKIGTEFALLISIYICINHCIHELYMKYIIVNYVLADSVNIGNFKVSKLLLSTKILLVFFTTCMKMQPVLQKF